MYLDVSRNGTTWVAWSQHHVNNIHTVRSAPCSMCFIWCARLRKLKAWHECNSGAVPSSLRNMDSMLACWNRSGDSAENWRQTNPATYRSSGTWSCSKKECDTNGIIEMSHFWIMKWVLDHGTCRTFIPWTGWGEQNRLWVAHCPPVLSKQIKLGNISRRSVSTCTSSTAVGGEVHCSTQLATFLQLTSTKYPGWSHILEAMLDSVVLQEPFSSWSLGWRGPFDHTTLSWI